MSRTMVVIRSRSGGTGNAFAMVLDDVFVMTMTESGVSDGDR